MEIAWIATSADSRSESAPQQMAAEGRHRVRSNLPDESAPQQIAAEGRHRVRSDLPSESALQHLRCFAPAKWLPSSGSPPDNQ